MNGPLIPKFLNSPIPTGARTMRIIVLVKQVPDTTEVKLDPKTGSLIREGIESIINPDDRHALEAAIGLKEAHGGKTRPLPAQTPGPPP
jgi:electron transfer flavoprotein beta subunit